MVEEGVVVIRDLAALGGGLLRVRAGATVRLDVAGEVAVSSLVIEPGGRVDIGAGRLTVAAGGGTPDDVRSQLLTGRGEGGWDGAGGFVTRLGDASAGVGLGYLVNDDASITVAYALAGDVNLDGQIDILDVSQLGAGGTYDTGAFADWARGDVNYDGVCDLLDVVGILAANGFDRGPYAAAPPAAASPPPTSALDAGMLSAWAAAFATLTYEQPAKVRRL